MSNLFATRFAALLMIVALSVCATKDSSGQEESNNSKEATIVGKVVDRKKYNLVIDDGKAKHKVVIANVGQVMLKLNRPLFDFEKKTVSVVPDGALQGSRKSYPISEPLFFINKFAHARQQERFMSADQKRLADFVISPSRPTKLQKLEMGGEFKKGTKIREYLLQTSDGKLEVMLGPNGRLDGLHVTHINPGDWAKVTVVSIDNQLVARSIEFQPAVDKKNDSSK